MPKKTSKKKVSKEIDSLIQDMIPTVVGILTKDNIKQGRSIRRIRVAIWSLVIAYVCLAVSTILLVTGNPSLV